MHYLPGAFFGSKDHRNPQIEWQDLLPSACLCLAPLYPHNVSKLRGHILLYNIEASDLAIADLRCDTLHSLSDLLPSMVKRTKRVKESCVFSMGEHHLVGFRVPFKELVQRSLTLLDYLVKIIYRSHLEITSIVGISAFPTGRHICSLQLRL
jgi:hypothetical protein